MTKLNELLSSGKKRKKVGRGGARGGTAGKGHKGQKARSGPTLGIAFEGGQMPLLRRLPKRGFNNARFRKEFDVVNLDRINNSFEPGTVITKELLVEKGIIKPTAKTFVKILGQGTLTKKLIVHADAFSKTAADAITAQGGEVHIIKEK